MTDELMRQEVRLEPDEEPLLREICAEFGLQVERAGVRAVDPVILVLVVTGSVIVVQQAIERWRERRAGGQVIDLRPGADPAAYRDRGVMYGLVVIYGTDGTVDVQVKEPANQMVALVQAILAAVLDSGTSKVGEIASLVESAVGGYAEITASRADEAAAGS